MKRSFAIVRQIAPSIVKPYRLLEAYDSSDGRRTRICAGTWATFEEAANEAAARSEDELIVQHGEDEASR